MSSIALNILLALAANPGVIRVESAQVTLIDEVSVPAKEAGALARLDVREGRLVDPGQEMGSIEADEAEMALAVARFELQMASEKATNDVDYRFAVKSSDVAKTELRRAEESIEKFPKSISPTELDRLKLTAQRAELSIEQAQRDLKLAGIQKQLKQQEVDTASLAVRRRKIVAPIGGMIVDVFHRTGEWVNPGESVVRILRLDKLRVEAYLSAKDVERKLLGREVRLRIEFAGGKPEDFVGAVVFVSPEVEPVSGQFRVWAEVENRDQLLSPGLTGTLTIEAAK